MCSESHFFCEAALWSLTVPSSNHWEAVGGVLAGWLAGWLILFMFWGCEQPRPKLPFFFFFKDHRHRFDIHATFEMVRVHAPAEATGHQTLWRPRYSCGDYNHGGYLLFVVSEGLIVDFTGSSALSAGLGVFLFLCCFSYYPCLLFLPFLSLAPTKAIAGSFLSRVQRWKRLLWGRLTRSSGPLPSWCRK